MGTQGKEKKKVKRDFRQIRSAIVMVCVAVTVLGTSSYAWFTISNQPKVTGLAMTAGATDGLTIAKVETDIYGDEISFASTPEKELSPVTIQAATGGTVTFGKPVYTGNTVKTVEAIDSADLEKYVAKYTYWLKSSNTETVKVCLKGGSTAAIDNVRYGSYVESNTAGAVQEASYSIRIGFKQGNNWAIYEPNADGEVTDRADIAVNEVAGPVIDAKLKQSKAGLFTNTPTDVSGELFSITGTTPVEVEMYIWLEGTDPDCANKIQLDKMAAQIQFVAVR